MRSALRFGVRAESRAYLKFRMARISLSDGGHLRGCFSAASVRFCARRVLVTARRELTWDWHTNKLSAAQRAVVSARLERELRESRLVEEVFVEAHAAQVAVEIRAHRQRARRTHAAAERQQVPRAHTARAAGLCSAQCAFVRLEYGVCSGSEQNQLPEEESF